MTAVPEATTLLAFSFAAVALIATPGANLIYILTRSIGQGRRAGLVSALGVETGTLVHVTGAALGVSSLVATSAVAFSVLRYAGAAYLVYLGVRTLRRPSQLDLAADTAQLPLGKVFRDGVLVNLLNPKVALFFLAFLPQFVIPGADLASARSQMLVLGAVFFVAALALDLGYALAGAAASSWLRRRPAFLRWQRYVVGGVYLGLGAYAALAGQPGRMKPDS